MREKISQVFDEFISKAHHNDGYNNEMIDQATNAILSLIRSELPEEKDIPSPMGYGATFDDGMDRGNILGHNAYRKAMLDKLGGE